MGRGGRGRDAGPPRRGGDASDPTPRAGTGPKVGAAATGASEGKRAGGSAEAAESLRSRGAGALRRHPEGSLGFVRDRLVARLAALERERAQQVARGHPELARRTLRAFQELARVLEYVDDLLGR